MALGTGHTFRTKLKQAGRVAGMSRLPRRPLLSATPAWPVSWDWAQDRRPVSALLSSVPACSRIPSLQPAQHGVTYVVNRLRPGFTRMVLIAPGHLHFCLGARQGTGVRRDQRQEHGQNG